MLLLLLACRAEPEIELDRPEPTDTFPSFYGEMPKNVLMVSIDTLRRDFLTRYGHDELLANYLEQLMAEGVVMENHHTCSNWTFPSVVCASTGQFALDSGYIPKMSDSYRENFPGTPTLASTLQDNGFYTALVTSNSWLSADYNTDYGFISSERPDSVSTANVFAVGRDRIEEAIAQGEEQWFLHVHIKEPHVAYNPPEQYLWGLEGLEEIPYDLTDFNEHYEMTGDWDEIPEEERELVLQHMLVRYSGEIRYMDDQLTNALADYEARGLLKDTLVVFWVDHGEQFWEHGQQTHAYSLHSEENNSIAFFWSPTIVAGSWEPPTDHTDIVPTVLALLGIESDVDYSGYALGTAPDDRALEAISVARNGPVQSVTHDNWRLIYTWITGSFELYDLTTDPGEQINLYDPAHPKAAELWALLSPRVQQAIPLVPEYSANGLD